MFLDELCGTFYHQDSCNLRYYNARFASGHSSAHLAGGQMKRICKNFWSDQSGATAIEYGLIAAGIALVIIAAVNGIGSTLSTRFGDLSSSLK